MGGEYLEHFYQYGTRVEVKKDEYIYNASLNPDSASIYLLDSGLCALMTTTRNGEEKIHLYFRAKRTVGFVQVLVGEYFGEPSNNFRLQNPAAFSIIAKTDCVLYRIQSSVFKQLMKDDPKFKDFTMQVVVENYVEILNRYHQAQEETADVRLCRLLLEQSKNKDGKLVLPKYFTCTELSKYLGIHAVTVSRLISNLKQKGYISKKGHGIIVERPDQIKIIIDAEINLEG